MFTNTPRLTLPESGGSTGKSSIIKFWKKTKRATRFMSIIPILLAGVCACGPEAMPGILLGGNVVKDIIHQAEESGRVLLGEARQTGDALAARGANELEVASKNVTNLVSDKLDEKFESLSSEYQLALQHLEKLRLTAVQYKRAAFKLKDALALDLRELSGAILPYTKTDFLIQRIEGITQLENRGDATITITGIGFGPDSDSRRNKIISISMDGKLVNGYRVERNNAHETRIIIPHATFQYDSKNVRIVNLKIQHQTESKKFFGGWNATKYDIPLYLSLIPALSGVLTVEYRLPKYGYAVIDGRREFKWTTPDHHQTGRIEHYTHDTSVVLPAGSRFTGPAGARKDGFGHPWAYEPQVSILDGNNRLRVSVEMWGHAFEVTYWAAVEAWKQIGEETKTLSVHARYGENLVFEIPRSANWWRITGQTSLFHKIDIIKEMSAIGEIEFRNRTNSGDKQIISYRVLTPDAGL